MPPGTIWICKSVHSTCSMQERDKFFPWQAWPCLSHSLFSTSGRTTLTSQTLAVRALQAGLFVYGYLLYCVVRAGLVRELEYRPDMVTLRGHSEELPGAAVLRWVANEYQESTERNKKDLRRKSRWVGKANIALYIEGVLLAIAAFLTLW